MTAISTATQTQDLIVVLSKPFYKILCDFYQSNDEFYMTRKQIGEALEYNNPQKAIDNIHERQNDRLSQFSVTLKTRAADGKSYNTIVYSLRGVMEICRFSRQPKADEFMDFVWDVMETLFRGEAVLAPKQSANPLLEQNILNLKQSQNQLIEDTLENSYHIGELRDRLETVESQSTSYISDKNYMLHPVYQQIFSSLVRLEGRYYQLKQENKAIRTELMLHHKEHNPEAYSKPKSDKSSKYPAKHTVTYFNSMECLFNDMKDTYQSFVINQKIMSENGSAIINSTLIFRLVEIYEDHLHFQVNKHNQACMDVFGITKAEKRIVDSYGVAEYKVYYDGGVEPVVFQAVPKRL